MTNLNVNFVFFMDMLQSILHLILSPLCSVILLLVLFLHNHMLNFSLCRYASLVNIAEAVINVWMGLIIIVGYIMFYISLLVSSSLLA